MYDTNDSPDLDPAAEATYDALTTAFIHVTEE
jgi:hypothetical protein